MVTQVSCQANRWTYEYISFGKFSIVLTGIISLSMQVPMVDPMRGPTTHPYNIFIFICDAHFFADISVRKFCYCTVSNHCLQIDVVYHMRSKFITTNQEVMLLGGVFVCLFAISKSYGRI